MCAPLKIIFLVLAVMHLSAMPLFAAEEFGKDHDARIVEILERLESSDPLIQMQSTLELLKEANNGDLQVLVNTLRKGNPIPKQVAIIRALRNIGDARAAEALKFEIEYGKEEAVLEALIALGAMKSNWGIPLLVNAMAPKHGEVSAKVARKTIYALTALGHLDTPRALDTLKTLRPETNPEFHRILEWILDYRQKKIRYDTIQEEIPRARTLTLEFEGVGFSFYYPSQYAPAPKRPWLLVCIPDSRFQIKKLFKSCWEAAKERHMGVLVPHFHPMQFLNYQEFNLAGPRSDTFLIRLLAYIQQHAEVDTNEIYMYGHNEGANFVERFVMAYPRRIARAVAVNGDIVPPDLDSYFPRGIRTTPYAPDLDINIYDYLKSSFYIFSHKKLEMKKQLERFNELKEDFKIARGVLPRVEVREVEGPDIILRFEDAMAYLFPKAGEECGVPRKFVIGK